MRKGSIVGRTSGSLNSARFTTHRRRALLCAASASAAMAFSSAIAGAQTNNYFGTSGTLSGNVWSQTSGGNPPGTYNQAFSTIGGGVMVFENTVTTLTGASLTVLAINASADVTTWGANGTMSGVNNAISLSVAPGKLLDFGTQTFTNGTSFVKNGTGTAVINSTMSNGANFTLNDGVMVFRQSSTAGGSWTLNGGAFAVAANRTYTLTGLTIGGNVTFGQPAGGANGAISNSTIGFITPTTALGGATRTFTLGNTSTTTMTGSITGNAGVGIILTTSSGGGTFSFAGSTANTFNGDVIVQGGTLSLNKTAGVTAVAGNVVVSGGTVSLLAAQQIADTSALSITGGTFGLGTSNQTVSSVLMTNGAITSGGGILTSKTDFDFQGASANITGGLGGNVNLVKSTSSSMTFTGAVANTYTGITSVTGGTLTLNRTAGVNAVPGNLVIGSGATVALSAGSQIADSSNITINNGTLSMGSSADTIASLSLLSGTISATSGIVTAGTTYDLQSGIISAVLAGNVGINKTTAGTVTISSASTLTGNVTVSAGSLLLTNVTTWSSAGTFSLSGTGRLSIVNPDANLASKLVTGIASGATLRLAANQTAGTSPGTIFGTLELGSAMQVPYTISLGAGGRVLHTVNSTTFTVGTTDLLGNATIDFGNATNTNHAGLITTSTTGTKVLTLNSDTISSSPANITGSITNGAGQLSILKTGIGRVALTNTVAASTLTGDIVIQQGTLSLDSSANNNTGLSSAGSGTIYLGDSSVTLSGATAMLAQVRNASIFINNPIVTQGSTTNVIGVAASLSNNLTYAGSVTLNTPLTFQNLIGGNVAINNNTVSTNGYAISATASAGTLAIGSVIVGSGALTVDIGGTATRMSLNGINSGWTGNITLNSGRLALNTDNAAGSGAIFMNNNTTLELGQNSGAPRQYDTGTITVADGGTATFDMTGVTSGRYNRIGAIDFGSGSGGTLRLLTSGGGSTQAQIVQTGAITFRGDSTINVGTTFGLASYVLNAQKGIADAGTSSSLIKTGDGTLMLGGTNVTSSTPSANGLTMVGSSGAVSSYGGATSIAAGSIRLGIDNAMPTGTTVYSATGTYLDLSANSGNDVVNVNVNQTLAGLNDLNGGGGLVHGNSINAANGGNVGNRTLTLGSSGSYTFSGGILNKLGTNTTANNVLTLTKSGTGTQVLNGTGGWTGGTNLLGGVLEVGAGGSGGGTGSVTMLGVTVGSNAFATGSGTVTLSSDPVAAGVQVGMRVYNNGIASGVTVAGIAGNVITLNGVTAVTTGASTLSFGFLDRVSVASTAGLAVGQGISGSGIASGTVITGISANTLYLSATNTNTSITSPVTATFGAWETLPSTGKVNFGGGTLRWGSGNTADYSSRFSTIAGQQYKLDTGSNSVTLATALNSAGGSLAKYGSGVLTLMASNTYAGPTTIAAGTLRLGASERIAITSDVTFAGGTLDTAGNEESVGNLGLTDNSTIDLGSGASILSFADAGNMDLSKRLYILNWSGDATNGGGTDQLIVSESNTLTQTQLASFVFINPINQSPDWYGATQLASGEIVPTFDVVPEPGMLGLLSIGGVGLLRRRRRASK